jgi:acid phosphatase (class A)
MKKFIAKTNFILFYLIFLSACTHLSRPNKPEPVPEILPGIPQGYIPMASVPNSLTILAPPPTENSAALQFDLEMNKQHLTMKGSKRWDLATSDADLVFPNAAGIFSCAVDAEINEIDTPYLYVLLRRSATDAGVSAYHAKKHYQRTRPFMKNNEAICTPSSREYFKTSGSYPSGHAAIGWTWALILAEIEPTKADVIFQKGLAFGESRMVCNLHWQSDIIAGRTMGAATVARLQSEPMFNEAIAIAKEELKAVREKGLKPTRECKAESPALEKD